MKFCAITLALSVALVGPVVAAPGAPRLMQGMLEWPPALTGGEPFIVVRGDDGRVCYADVMAAQRHVQAAPSAGSHIALLGLEGTKPHEIIVVALGSGDAAALSLALAQATPTASLTTPTPRATPPAQLESGRSAPGKERRWVTIRGRVHGVGGQNLFLKKDDGGVVAVDIAKLDPITAGRLRLGSSVAVVVVPLADKFEATGLIETEPAKPAR